MFQAGINSTILPKVELGKWCLSVIVFNYTNIYQLRTHLIQYGIFRVWGERI